MSRHRHSDQNRTHPGSTPAKIRRLVEWYRRIATRRKLLLLECGIVRHAPFADCGRPLWDLMVDQNWFMTTMPPAEYLRLQEATRQIPEPPSDEVSWRFFRMSGHQAIRWLEQYADDLDEDRLLFVQKYVSYAEWSAEAERFDPPEERRGLSEISYGAASWLCELSTFDSNLGNLLDFYLANYPGAFYAWGRTWRPLHPEHRPVALSLIEDILGNPVHSIRFDARWRTSNTAGIASAMYESRDFTAAPILADALEESGCDNEDMLTHCRTERRHCRGCWVVDRVLGKL